MLIVFTITEKLTGNHPVKIKTTRSYASKDSVLTAFLQKHPSGETETEAPKLIAYNNTIEGAEILAINRHAGCLTTLEVLHTDKVNEV